LFSNLSRKRFSQIDPQQNELRLWIQGVGAMARGAEITRLGAVSHGAEIFATALMWRRHGSYLGAITGGAELGASCCGAQMLLERWRCTTGTLAAAQRKYCAT